MNLVQGHNDYYYLLKKHLIPEIYELMAAGDSAPSLNDLRSLEGELSLKLPDDFVSFSISRLSGLYIKVREDFWPPSREFDIRPAWAFESGLWVYGLAPTTPRFMDLRVKAAEFKNETGQTFAPCLNVIADADFYGFTPDGQLGRWSYDEERIEPVEGSFIELLDRETGELASRQVQMQKEQHKFTA